MTGFSHLLFILGTGYACQATAAAPDAAAEVPEEEQHEVFKWPNVLGPGAWFFDQGSAHGYAASSTNDFVGPAPDWNLSDSRTPTWLLGVTASDGSRANINLTSTNWTSYPGGLRSINEKEGITFEASFVHLTHSVGLVRLSVVASSSIDISHVRFSISLTHGATELVPNETSSSTLAFEMSPSLQEACLNGSNFRRGHAAAATRVWPTEEAIGWTLQETQSQWSILSSDVPIVVGDGRRKVATYLLISSLGTWDDPIYRKRNSAHDLEDRYRQSVIRWDGYLQKALQSVPTDDFDPIPLLDRQWVAVKSVLTLMNNWRFVPGLPDGVLPSYTGYRTGFWSWDTYKSAVGMALFFPRMAQEQLELIVSAQDPATGHIPDLVNRCGAGAGCSGKPPLLSWAVWEVYQRSQDMEFLRKMRPAIERFHAFWYQHRDVTGEGLCSWTEGMESGMDDAVRFLPNYTRSVSNATTGVTTLNEWAVDLNSYLYREKRVLADIANELGDVEAAKSWKTQAELLLPTLRKVFFVAGPRGTGFFQDSYFNGTNVPVEGCEGYAALFCHVATQEQALAMTATLSDPDRFLLPFSLPTVSKKNTFYNGRGYWKGSAWLDQTWFAYEGLKHYGRQVGGRPAAELAAEIRRRIFEVGKGFSHKDTTPFNEHYDPGSSDPLGATHFSWTATHALLWAIDLLPSPRAFSDQIVI